MTLKEAINIMLAEVNSKIAKGYILELDNVVDKEGMDGLIAQIKYIRANLSSWRGENARNVKAFLDNWLEQKATSEKKDP